VLQIVFSLEFLYVRDLFVPLLSLSHLSDFVLHSGRNHDYQNLNLTYAKNVVKTGMIIGMFPKPLKPWVVSLYQCCLVTETHTSIVFRMLSNIPSQIQQKIELIGPMVEERFAKMEEHGEDWHDKPVCQTIVSVIFLMTRSIRRMIC